MVGCGGRMEWRWEGWVAVERKGCGKGKGAGNRET